VRIGIDGLLLGAGYTGVEHSVEALAEALPLAAPQHDYALACTRQYASATSLALPRRPAPAWVSGKGQRIAFEQCGLARLLSDCDLLHAPAYVMPLNWCKPSVLTVYDLIALQYPQWCTRNNVLHYGLMLPRSLRAASAIVAPSEVVAAALSERFPKVGAKVRVIPLGVAAHFRPAAPEPVRQLREALSLPEQFILCVGNLEPKKNLVAIIEAFDLIADEIPHHLVLQGKPAWGYVAVLCALRAARHGDRIQLLETYLPGPQLASLYTAADLLVQWSLYEGFGLPPLEAMACGTPALVSDGGSLAEIAGPAAEVVPLDEPIGRAQQLALRLRDLLLDPGRLATLRALGLAHAAHYTWPAHARAVAALYEELVNE